MPWGSQDSRWEGLSWRTTLVPGGSKGVLLKSKTPSSTVCADSWGCRQEARIMFNVMVACGNKRHHRCMVNCESVLHNPAMKWFSGFWWPFLPHCVDACVVGPTDTQYYFSGRGSSWHWMLHCQANVLLDGNHAFVGTLWSWRMHWAVRFLVLYWVLQSEWHWSHNPITLKYIYYQHSTLQEIFPFDQYRPFLFLQ